MYELMVTELALSVVDAVVHVTACHCSHHAGGASEQAYGQGMTVAALEAQALHGILQVCLFA